MLFYVEDSWQFGVFFPLKIFFRDKERIRIKLHTKCKMSSGVHFEHSCRLPAQTLFSLSYWAFVFQCYASCNSSGHKMGKNSEIFGDVPFGTMVEATCQHTPDPAVVGLACHSSIMFCTQSRSLEHSLGGLCLAQQCVCWWRPSATSEFGVLKSLVPCLKTVPSTYSWMLCWDFEILSWIACWKSSLHL